MKCMYKNPHCFGASCASHSFGRKRRGGRRSPSRNLRTPPRGPTFYSLPFPPGACGTSSGAGSTVVITKKVVVPNGPTFYNLIDAVNWIDTGKREGGIMIVRHKDGNRPLAGVPICLEAIPKQAMTRVPTKSLSPLQRKLQANTFKAKRNRR